MPDGCPWQELDLSDLPAICASRTFNYAPHSAQLDAGDVLALGPLNATVVGILGHPRVISLCFEGTPDAIWAGIARHGKPIQYAHVAQPLALWDVWTRVAALPVAFEPPSAGFVLDWKLLKALETAGIGFATLTHAAGISSTGDPALDARLPFDEPYHLPERTVQAIARTKAGGGRVIALGTTVTRAPSRSPYITDRYTARPRSTVAHPAAAPMTRPVTCASRPIPLR